MQLSSDFEEEHEIIPKSYRSAQNLNSMRDHQQNFASVETRPKIQKSSNENSGGGKAGEREPKRVRFGFFIPSPTKPIPTPFWFFDEDHLAPSMQVKAARRT